MTSLSSPELIAAVYGRPGHRRRNRRISIALGLVLILGLSALIAWVVAGRSEPTCRVAKDTTPTCGVWWGAALEAADSQLAGAVNAEEATTGRRLDIVHTYHLWYDTFPTPAEAGLAHNGRQLFLNWEPVQNDHARTPIPWNDIAIGAQDHQIDVEAKRLKSLGVPVFVSFAHEPEAHAGRTVNTATDFAAAFRYVVTRMRRDGVSNVSWVWNVQGLTDSNWPQEYVSMWPGNDYVSWVAWDPYNWDDCKAGHTTTFQSFAATVAPFYEYLESSGFGDKPFMIAETGTVEDRQPSQSKADWFAGVSDALATMPNIKALVYYDKSSATGNCEWQAGSSSPAMVGYKALAHAPVFSASARISLPRKG